MLILFVSLSVWGDADKDGCPDNSDIIKDMKDDTSKPCQGSDYKSPSGRNYIVTDWFPCHKAKKPVCIHIQNRCDMHPHPR